MTDPLLQTPSGRVRARGAGIPLPGAPGRCNAITDVDGVAVGYRTLIEGDAVRTGVTAILPRPPTELQTPVFGGYHSLNGNGELTGTIWVDEAGTVDTPITITNTHSCGTARDATIKWLRRRYPGLDGWSLPVAGETYDGYLNDIDGFHVQDEHVFDALDAAQTGALEEGSVGGGTGMICYGYKGGSGTASRIVDWPAAATRFVVGAFVQANFGRREQLTIAGVPVGAMLDAAAGDAAETGDPERGSVIAVIATDAPLLPHQLKRLARRVGLGIARGGATSGHGSGDIFLAFSTAHAAALAGTGLARIDWLPDAELSPLFDAVVESVDEAVLNSMIANETMRGRDGHVVEALPIDAVRKALREHRLALVEP